MSITNGVNLNDPKILEFYQKHLNQFDKEGNSDGKVDIQEALNGLNIGNMLNGQSPADLAKLKSSTANIQEVLTKYAGEDGVFSALEWAEFQNGKEWKQVMDTYQNSSGFIGPKFQEKTGQLGQALKNITEI